MLPARDPVPWSRRFFISDVLFALLLQSTPKAFGVGPTA